MPISVDALANDFPNLFQFFGGYFHQDWPDMYENADAAINDYLSVPRPEVEAAAEEIDRLLACSTDNELTEILDALGNSYYYESDGFSARTWLAVIRSRLETSHST